MLAEGLMQRLQFPLTLGSFKKLLEVGQGYVEKLQSSRMLKDDRSAAEKIGKELTTGYADHSWCITVEEASKIGLKASEIKEEDWLGVIWEIHGLQREKERLIAKEEEQENAREDEGTSCGLEGDLAFRYGQWWGTERSSRPQWPEYTNLAAKKERTVYNSRVPTKLAAAILIQYGEISFGEIRALPLVEDEQSVLAIADLLAHNFPVTRFGRWEDGAPSSRFEDVIRLIEHDERSVAGWRRGSVPSRRSGLGPSVSA